MSPADSTAVECVGVRKVFRNGTTSQVVLDGVHFSMRRGEWVGIVGASGSGKTTLLNIIAGLDADFDGETRTLGQSLRGLSDDRRAWFRNRSIGFVFQAFHLLSHLSVLENVKTPLWLSQENLRPREETERAHWALGVVGLLSHKDARIGGLSGGERQRVAIARALVTHPSIILADEPTGNLDERTSATILDVLQSIRMKESGEAASIVIVTHDDKVARRADRVVLLENKRLVESRPVAPRSGDDRP